MSGDFLVRPGRWRKVAIGTWGDSGFSALSKSAPSGQLAWLYLLTAPASIALPGAIAAGPAALAESLKWSRAAFLRCFGEIEAQGMARADWAAGVVWLPNALKHNPPQNPNAVKAWAKGWAELPDCSLKSDMRAETERFLERFGGQYLESFRQQLGEQRMEVVRTRGEKKEKEEKSAEPKKPREPSKQQRFAEWFEEQRRGSLGDAHSADNALAPARLNKELEWLDGVDSGDVAEAARIYLGDPKRQQQDPPCSLLWFSKDRAAYLSKAKRSGAAS